MAELHAYLAGRRVGVFYRAKDSSTVGFEYADGYESTPLSLSLPVDGHRLDDAPQNFLDNLLPDSDSVRERWAREREVASVKPFDLLSAFGEDVSGR